MSDAVSTPAFPGKVAIVTGGSSGVGFAVARALAREGAKVAIVGRRKQALDLAAAVIQEASGAKALALAADVAAPLDCDRIVEATIERFGALDILVNNAALFALVPLLDGDAAQAKRFFATNVIGALECARAFARRAFADSRGGAIVNVSSITAGRPAPGCGLYSATKAALEMLTRTMALEWGPKGMRVNAVAPGHVATEGVIEDFRAGRLNEEAMLRSIPARRIADVDDVADAVLFLCSDKARHFMGAVLTVDGGEGM
jgi:3-oxoacyl-[acyl-carrier protein] reductase